MIVPTIIIDTSDAQFAPLNREQIDNLLDNIAKALAARFAEKLEERAEQELHQTRTRYIRNIKLVDSGRLEGTVLLDFSKDPLIEMIEQGAAAFDMKQYFLKSAKVKIGKNGGKFLTIPFRWATPGAIGEADVFSGKLPEAVYNVVKKKSTDIPVSGGGTRSAGLKLKEVPEQFQIRNTRPAIADNQGNKLFEAYQHKNSLYEGLIKQKDSVTGQNTYHSFRRVSENSDDDSWIHPGIEQYNLMQKTLSEFNIGEAVGEELDNEFAKLGLL